MQGIHHSLPFLLALVLGLLCQVVNAGALEKLLMPGALTSAHAKYEDDCGNCHSPLDKAVQERDRCLDCHKETRGDIREGRGFHGHALSAGADCRQCHSEHQGREADIVGLVPSLFDHDQTDFRLRGAHRLADCASCHDKDKLFREASSRCIDCHREQDVHREAMGDACGDCHSQKQWRGGEFDHAETDFPLRGEHRDVACVLCHQGRDYDRAPSECVACHQLQDIHGGLFGKDCVSCHSEKAWDKATFDHDRKTDFPLRGRHALTDCHRCHTAQTRGRELASDCRSCHRPADVHQGRFGNQCGDCHTPKGWGKQAFDHAMDGGFALLGGHKNVPCNACHTDSTPRGKTAGGTRLVRRCSDCHRLDDPHQGRQGDACGNCHGTDRWARNTRFDHDLSRFPLIGMHAIAPCAECHLDPDYSATPADCYACHRDADQHAAGLGEDCGGCHNPNSWTRWQFDHDTQTDYPLEGRHREAGCRDCHRHPAKNHQQLQTATRCVDCHLANDAHSGGFGAACERCHQPSSFQDLNIR